MNKKASVAKWVALAVVPLSLTAVLANVAQKRRAEAATKRLSKSARIPNSLLGPEELKELIAQGADVNVHRGMPSGQGTTALHRAAYNNIYNDRNFKNAVILLDNGAKVNALDDVGETALTIAVQARNVELVRLLLHKGADANLSINGVDGKRRTPLLLARDIAQESSDVQIREIIQLLKAAGAKE